MMDKGGIGEYDSPNTLANITDGLLSTLIDETGPESAAYLRRIASGEKPFSSDIKRILPAVMAVEPLPVDEPEP